jgi:uncharacterized membrane protein
MRTEWLAGTLSTFTFIAHYMLVALAAFIIAHFLRSVRIFATPAMSVTALGQWIAAVFIVFLASTELDHIVIMIGTAMDSNYAYLLRQNQKIGYPIIWGLCSFVYMLIGIREKVRQLRIISLALFFIILLKLFLFDIRGMSEGGKIASFIILGVLLLIVSFLYQKLKEIILTDSSGDETEKEAELS